ncbi:DUF2868 domain-containing protein [Wohlfahrtiimonas chitiniclastica]|uniref:DUF2868 domain-containing protein n=1 Tax=Wohlfahrtiimonas chitiniclastica TaxID=400946 RepID=UPI000B98D410|nr:DUF2868 domain-containing protein [Wohlfahrtiimonas chitiniclastica]OYQ76463.1 hypothetical protein B9T18_03610 [Wohlfahrtiimonas chitiniclastica]
MKMHLEPHLHTVMRHWRILFVLWIVLTILSTLFGSSSLIASPIHPLYFVLVMMLPSTLFLIFSLITAHSLFAELFLQLKNLIFKQDHAPNLSTPLPVRYIAQLISNATWLTILITTLLVLFFKFTFQHFDFYLGNTFTESQSTTDHIVHYLNWLPSKLGLIEFDDAIIQASFQSGKLADEARSMWAKWIIVMILMYGIVPRLLVFIYYVIRALRHQKFAAVAVSDAVIEDAAKEKPLVIRAPKAPVIGDGHYRVALDITEQTTLPDDVVRLNDIEAFQQFESARKVEPAQWIEIMIDGNLMPDRGILRRLIRLMNQAEKATIHVLTDDPHQTQMWQHHLSSIIVDGEAADYEIK